jgi:hypothetical protein
MTDLAAAAAKLRGPFPKEAIGHLPRGGKQLDYVGHAAVTDRLLTVDPTWSWEPFSVDEAGQPVLVYRDGKPVGLWIRLTVCGITRPGYGSVEPGAFDAVKQLIGDALRNAAMRFGVALDLWAKEDLGGAEFSQTAQVAETRKSSSGVGQDKSEGGAAAQAQGTPAPDDASPATEKQLERAVRVYGSRNALAFAAKKNVDALTAAEAADLIAARVSK